MYAYKIFLLDTVNNIILFILFELCVTRSLNYFEIAIINIKLFVCNNYMVNIPYCITKFNL